MRDLDKHIFEGMKEELSDFQLSVEDHVWTAIESDLGLNERKKRFAWWWWVLVGAFLIGLGWWLFAATSFNGFSKPKVSVSNSRNTGQNMFPAQGKSSQELRNNVAQAEIVWNEARNLDRPVNHESSDAQIPDNTILRSSESNAKSAESSYPNQDSSKAIPQMEIVSEKGFVIDPKKVTNLYSSVTESAYVPESKVINIGSHKRKLSWSLLAYGAAGISYRTLSGNQAQSLVDHRNTHESRGLSINAGLASHLDISSKLFVRAGLAYAEYQEKYSFHHDVISHETVNGYKYLQLTASFGSVLFGKGRSKIAVLGGPKVGRLLNAQSSWVDPSSLNAVAHSSGQNNQPFQVWTVALNATLEYQLTVSPRITAHAQLALDGNLNSTYKKSTLLTQRPYALLFGLGVRYGFQH